MEKPKQRKQNKEHKGSKADTSIENSPPEKVKASTPKRQASTASAVFQGLFISVLFFFLASYLITDTWLWGYNGKYVNWRHWIPVFVIVCIWQIRRQLLSWED